MGKPSGPDDVVGLMPAAGFATRLGESSGSKEMLPLPSAAGGPEEPACHRLLEAFLLAGIRRVIVVLRPEKKDLLHYLQRDPVPGLDVEVLSVSGGTPSVPHTLVTALRLLANREVALGFPDALFRPPDAFVSLVRRHREGRSAVTLGLFPAAQPETTDMVDFAPDGRVRAIHPRPHQTDLSFNWLLALWRPAFTELLVQAVEEPPAEAGTGELQLGSLFQRAIGAGLRIEGVPFPEGSYRDIGTRESYAAIRKVLPRRLI